jgi:D-alanine-D-alanine ligase
MEINLLELADSEVYSYRNKEECEELVRYNLLPHGELRSAIESLVLDSWRALGCRDAGRIDVRLDEKGRPGFIEVNPLAGIHPEHSDLPIMATMSGMSYTQLIRAIMDSAVLRYGLVDGRQTLSDKQPTMAA